MSLCYKFSLPEFYTRRKTLKIIVLSGSLSKHCCKISALTIILNVLLLVEPCCIIMTVRPCPSKYSSLSAMRLAAALWGAVDYVRFLMSSWDFSHNFFPMRCSYLMVFKYLYSLASQQNEGLSFMIFKGNDDYKHHSSHLECYDTFVILPNCQVCDFTCVYYSAHTLADECISALLGHLLMNVTVLCWDTYWWMYQCFAGRGIESNTEFYELYCT